MIDNITMIDTPPPITSWSGAKHRKNIIRALSQADLAVLVVTDPDQLGTYSRTVWAWGDDSVREVYDKREKQEMDDQQCTLLAIAKAVGVNQLLVVVTDRPSQSRWATQQTVPKQNFEEIKTRVSARLEQIGFDPAKVPFIAVTTSLIGSFPSSRQEIMYPAWYNGLSLIEHIKAVRPGHQGIDCPLRLPILSVLHVAGVGPVGIGRVSSGILRQGMDCHIGPTSTSSTRACSIQKNNVPMIEAVPGDLVGFQLENSTLLRRGYVVSETVHSARAALSFEAQIVVLDSAPCQSLQKLQLSSVPLVHCHTARAPCRIAIINSMPNSDNRIESSPESLGPGDHAMLTFVPTIPFVVESSAEFPGLSHITVYVSKQLVAVGTVRVVVHRP